MKAIGITFLIFSIITIGNNTLGFDHNSPGRPGAPAVSPLTPIKTAISGILQDAATRVGRPLNRLKELESPAIFKDSAMLEAYRDSLYQLSGALSKDSRFGYYKELEFILGELDKIQCEGGTGTGPGSGHPPLPPQCDDCKLQGMSGIKTCYTYAFDGTVASKVDLACSLDPKKFACGNCQTSASFNSVRNVYDYNYKIFYGGVQGQSVIRGSWYDDKSAKEACEADLKADPRCAKPIP